MKPSIGARFDGLSDVERKVVKALWQFRPGARLPFPLVELAVEVETGESRYIAFGNIVSAGFLKLVVQHDGFKQFMFYELPQEVSTWLTEQGLARKWEGLFQGPQLGTASNVQPANLPRPAGSTLGEIKTEPLQEGRGAAAAAAAAASADQGLKEKPCLLAAFLASYGNDQGSVNVPQEAERFLNEELGLGVRNWAKPDLSQHPHARKLTYWIEEGLRAETVVSAVLASSGADFMGIPELKQGPRQLFDIFISNNRAGGLEARGRYDIVAFIAMLGGREDLSEQSERYMPRGIFEKAVKLLREWGWARTENGSGRPSLVDGAKGLAQGVVEIDLGACESLRAIPPEIGQLKGLRSLTLSSCTSLGAIPPEIGQLKALKHLTLEGGANLEALPKQIGMLEQLTSLHLSGASSLSALPKEIGKLKELKSLNLISCTSLEALPEEIGQLKALKCLNLLSCTSLKALPEEIGQLKALESLTLNQVTSLETLPKEIGRLEKLKSLDLSSTSVTALPAEIGQLKALECLSLFSCNNLKALPKEVGQLQKLCSLNMQQCEKLLSRRWGGSHDGGSPNGKIQWILKKAAVEELATRQEPMVSTLERMLLLVVLLTIATFIAYLLPPGSYVQGSDGASMVRSGNLTLCEAGSHHSGTREARNCGTLLFFIFDELSFGLCISCVMMIIVVSLPRVPTRNKEYEAGRFFILLALTWALLWLAVVSGFAAFLFSGLAVLGTWTVVGPLIPSMILLVASFVFLVDRVMRLYPGAHAIRLVIMAIGCWICCRHPPFLEDDMEDIEIGRQGSIEFWGRSASRLRPPQSA